MSIDLKQEVLSKIKQEALEKKRVASGSTFSLPIVEAQEHEKNPYLSALDNRAQMYKDAALLVINESFVVSEDPRRIQAEQLVENLFQTFSKTPTKEALKKFVGDLQILLQSAPALREKKATAGRFQVMLQSLRNAVPVLKKKETQKLLGEKGAEKSLYDAENLLNWREKDETGEWKAKRKETSSITEIQVGEKTFYALRVEEPQSTPTKEQLLDMQKIFSENEEKIPKWFKSLPAWEQNYFKKEFSFLKGINLENPDMLQTAKEAYENTWGVPPTTVRKFPFLANYSKSKTYLYDEKGDFAKEIPARTRSGNLDPFGIKSEEEEVKVTVQNLRQIIENEAVEALAKMKDNHAVDEKGNTILPVLVQTLVRPFVGSFAASAIGKDAETPLLKHKEEAIRRLSAEYAETPLMIGKEKIKIQFIDSNYSLNRGGSKTPVFQKFQYSESGRNIKAMQTVQALATLNTDASDLLFVQARAQYNKLSEYYETRYGYTTSGIVDTLTPGETGLYQDKNTFFLEIAALEQILISRMGIATGGCKSGKDRKGVLSDFEQAMELFWAVKNRFPNFADPEDQKTFGKIFAQLFLSRFQEQLAANNAAGAEGLKAAASILPNWLKEHIGTELLKNAGISEEKISAMRLKDKIERADEFIEKSERRASLNKVKKEKNVLKKSLAHLSTAFQIGSKTAINPNEKSSSLLLREGSRPEDESQDFGLKHAVGTLRDSSEKHHLVSEEKGVLATQDFDKILTETEARLRSSYGEKIKIEKNDDPQSGKSSLTVRIPNRELGKENTDQETIKQYQNNGKIETTLSSNPSEEAIKIMFEMNKDCFPLEMDECGNPETLMKIFKVMKAEGLKIDFHPADQRLLEQQAGYQKIAADESEAAPSVKPT